MIKILSLIFINLVIGFFIFLALFFLGGYLDGVQTMQRNFIIN